VTTGSSKKREFQPLGCSFISETAPHQQQAQTKVSTEVTYTPLQATLQSSNPLGKARDQHGQKITHLRLILKHFQWVPL
jgi:hypothetical protein